MGHRKDSPKHGECVYFLYVASRARAGKPKTNVSDRNRVRATFLICFFSSSRITKVTRNRPHRTS